MSVIVLSAGGTGGHLFPAQALAGELVKRGRDIVVMTDSRFANYATHFPGAVIATVPSSPFNALTAPFKIAAGIVVAFFKLLKLKPDAVIGFGGYPSVPVMVAATLARLPTAIIEQNAVVGRANRLVMNKVKVVAAAFPIARFAPRDTSKVVLTGNPLRPEVEALWNAPYKVPEAGGPLRLLVFGGSQGARAMSEIVPAALTRLPHDMKLRLSVVQQCRPDHLCQCRDSRRAAALLHRPAQAHGRDASGDRPFRRRHGGGADGHWPPRHPGAAARRAGRQPDAQRRHHRARRCRLAFCPERTDTGTAFPAADFHLQ